MFPLRFNKRPLNLSIDDVDEQGLLGSEAIGHAWTQPCRNAPGENACYTCAMRVRARKQSLADTTLLDSIVA